ncbi:shikimate dehydrogenase [Rhizobium sp. TRM95111]|uniref:shikimate dehydrogenase family protein n=1 Tax=Rhizobium alarense TaxID=2846851 RepID=UPI001F232845|nr:shikimate dehydrogenase [Rhizobium alarense]MCF3640179.1 shikimate dehydrogenase [Rhizobium alarense]
MTPSAIRLGLIGDNITRSQSPRLHVLAGRLCGLDVSYERLVPADRGQSFDAVFEACRTGGYRGINITYPYKEEVTRFLSVPDRAIAAIGACNTVIFGAGQPVGYNTDYTGFMRAYRAAFGGASPGPVAMAGAGGVGKAVAFGLAGLGCPRLSIYDRAPERVKPLVAALERSGFAMETHVAGSIDEAVEGAQGLVNCTPLGMVGYPGTAIPQPLIEGRRWAFDAVYTPVDTEFLVDCRAAGVEIISGYELFFHQGVDAFHLFTGATVDAEALRRELARPDSIERISA